MRDLVYKAKAGILRTISSQWKDILSSFFAGIGVLFSLAEMLNSIFKSDFGFNFLRTYTAQILVVLIVICFRLKWQSLSFTCFLEDTDTRISLQVGNIFYQKGALVIPTNSTFDTTMDNEFISIHSVQGQYQQKYYLNNLSHLNNELQNALVDYPHIVVNDGRTTNTNRYSIGTTCKISNTVKGKVQHAYFLAVADINKFGKPENVTLENLTQALVYFWQQLNQFGHLETILMPIIGTGRAGIKNASRDQIIREIIFSFTVAAREMKVTENLVICISPKDFAQKNLHWDDLCEYLRYICKYQYHRSTIIEGKVEQEHNVGVT